MNGPATSTRWEDLPGWEIISAGLNDIAEGRTTPAACAVWIVSPRLRKIGLVSANAVSVPEPELTLYRLLRQTRGNSYAEYNALLRRIRRFEHALDRLVWRQ